MNRKTLALRSALAGLLLPCASALQATASEPLVPRQVTAHPADLVNGTLRLPDPRAGAVRSRAAIFDLQWRAQGAGAKRRWRAEVRLPVAPGPLGLAVQGFDAGDFELGLAVAGLDGALDERGGERRDQALPPELGGQQVQRWDLILAGGGQATVSVEARGAHAPGPARLVVRDAGPLTAAAWIDSHARVSDEELALVAQVERGGAAGLVETVTSAWAELEGPGFSGRLPLRDDGLGGDGAAGDGRFGVRLPLGLAGSYAARVVLDGVSGGEGFLRTTRVTFDVAEPLLELTGAVRTEVLDARRMRLDLEALPLADARRVQVSAEVWGHDVWGRLRPMVWLSRIDGPRLDADRPGHWSLPLWLDAGWFAATGLRPPLELRSVRVQDPDHHGVLASAAALPVPAGALPPAAGRVAVPLTQLMGATVNASVPLPPSAPAVDVIPSPGLVLSHGYCSGGNPWPDADFSAPKLAFADPNQNRSHDQFANLIAAQAAGFTSFGVVGHSQGGPAALHLLTYYQSPLDLARGPRRIQSVGAPYQGTPLASLGFFACGVNNDLTPAGSSAWLAGIPGWARAEVWYHTTANDGAACQFLTNLILSDPEDGTTERARGQLPGGQNMGHVTGWCHTTSMSDPPQYRDGARNAVMDAMAAR